MDSFHGCFCSGAVPESLVKCGVFFEDLGSAETLGVRQPTQAAAMQIIAT
jgi:hypothetical protein